MRGFDCGKCGVGNDQVSHRFAAHNALLTELNLRAHGLQHFEQPDRVSFEANIGDHRRRSRHKQACHDWKSR